MKIDIHKIILLSDVDKWKLRSSGCRIELFIGLARILKVVGSRDDWADGDSAASRCCSRSVACSAV